MYLNLKMKQQNTILTNFRSKEWWKGEMKQINWTDILILIAFILLFLQTNSTREIAKDPCGYCVINNLNYEGERITCKDYIRNRIQINQGGLNGQLINISNTNIKR